MICMEGDEGDGIYIIDDGDVCGWVIDRNAIYQPFTEDLRVGSVFGEISFFLETKRTATLQSKANSRLFLLEKKYKKIFMTNCPTIFRRIRK